MYYKSLFTLLLVILTGTDIYAGRRAGAPQSSEEFSLSSMQTTRLRCRPLLRKDKDFLKALFSDETTYKNFGHDTSTDIQADLEDLQPTYWDSPSGKIFPTGFIIELKNPSEPALPIGYIDFSPDFRTKKQKYNFELAYAIHPSYRGHGYAKEAASALVSQLLEFLKEDPRVNKIKARVLSHNVPSLTILQQLGFVIKQKANNTSEENSMDTSDTWYTLKLQTH